MGECGLAEREDGGPKQNNPQAKTQIPTNHQRPPLSPSESQKQVTKIKQKLD